MGKWFIKYFLYVLLFFSALIHCSCADDGANLTDEQRTIESVIGSLGKMRSYTADYEVYSYGKLVFIGHIKYKKPNFYKKAHHPLNNESYQIIEICDGKYVWHYTVPLNNVVKTIQNNKSINVFGSTSLLLDKNYSQVAYLGNATINGVRVYKLLIDDIGKQLNEAAASKCLIYISDNGLIYQIDYFDKNDVVDIALIFKNYATNIEIPDAEFVFQMPDDASLQDKYN